MRIDSHQHFWIFDPVRDSWIDDSMSVIQRNFMPEDLAPILKVHNLDGCVAVQAAQDDAQTVFLLDLAKKNDFIKGVVGWIDLQADDLEKQLEKYSETKKLSGFRHILQGENAEFMLQPKFLRGLKTIFDHSYTYDILIFPKHLPNSIKLVQKFENCPFVIDHIAKPSIKDGLIDDWKKDIKAIAKFPNVFCKISGIITEADWKKWTPEQIEPYLDIVFEAFGTNRIMYGSDWPVCLVAGQYSSVIGLIESYISTLTISEKSQIMGLNATRFYGIS